MLPTPEGVNIDYDKFLTITVKFVFPVVLWCSKVIYEPVWHCVGQESMKLTNPPVEASYSSVVGGLSIFAILFLCFIIIVFDIHRIRKAAKTLTQNYVKAFQRQKWCTDILLSPVISPYQLYIFFSLTILLSSASFHLGPYSASFPAENKVYRLQTTTPCP